MKSLIYIGQVILSVVFLVGMFGWTAYMAKACMVSPAEVKSLIQNK